MTLFARSSRQAEVTRLRDELQAAGARLADARASHDAAIGAIREYIITEIASAPQCPHNVRPSCGRCQWRAGLSRALELVREAADLP